MLDFSPKFPKLGQVSCKKDEFAARFTNKVSPRSQKSKIEQRHRVRLGPKCLHTKFQPSKSEFRTSLPCYKRVRQSPPPYSNECPSFLDLRYAL